MKKFSRLFANFVVILLALDSTEASPPLQLSPFNGFESGVDASIFPYASQRDGGIFAGVRLPQDVTPLHYNVVIRPIINLPLDDPQQFTAPGEVTIRLRSLSTTVQNIILHSNDIDILYDGVTIKDTGTGFFVPVVGHSNDSSINTITFQLGSALDPRLDYDLFIPYIAKVGDRLYGLYRSSYVDAEGRQKWLATTQFQSIGARTVFPCFDEPGFRSTFNVTIGREASYTSLANSPLKETIPIPGMQNWFWDIHEQTVSMPTYLVAMVISDFVSVDAPAGITDYGVKIWGPPTMTDAATAEYSSKAAAEIVKFFETYLNSTYQFPKLDSVAVPDFSAGAMENWALNIYRLVYLLYFEGESTQMEQWRQAAVIAHEISHHWFGDLVTCKWWNDVWLNEGFASYMEIIGANVAGPGFGAMDRYPIDKIQLAMDFDAGPGTTPVRNNLTDELGGFPSRIIYEKAASLIRMMQTFLTEDTFITAIRNYLDKYAYDNTVQDQLFAELQTQADADGSLTAYTIKEIMDSWTLYSGFPVVFLRHAGGDVVQISQEKFRTSQTTGKENTTQNGNLWFVPVSYATKGNPDFSPTSWKPKLWLDNTTFSVTTAIAGARDSWIILNPDARSYYRVLYDDHFFPLLKAQLMENSSIISLASRSQIIDDYFKSAFAGYVPIEDALELTQYLGAESENTVWTTVFNNLRTPNRRLLDTPFYTNFSSYLLGKVTPPLDAIGWRQLPTDLPVTIILRSQLLDWACALGSQQCETYAVEYVTLLAEGGRIPADIQPMMFCKAVSIADSLDLPGQFNIKGYIMQEYMKATRAERFTVFLNSLACDAPSYVLGWLELATSNTSLFTKAHAIQLIQRLSENTANRETIINYFQSDIERIITGLGQSSISSVVSSMAAYTSEITTSQQLKSFIDFALKIVTEDNVKDSLTSSRALLNSNAEWVTTWGTKICGWLAGLK